MATLDNPGEILAQRLRLTPRQRFVMPDADGGKSLV
jgi:hypothetical protein